MEITAALPELLWFVLVAILLFLWRKRLPRLVDAVEARLAAGASLKLGFLELGAVPHVSQNGSATSLTNDQLEGVERTKLHDVRRDDGSLGELRRTIYEKSRGIMLVHRLVKSSSPGQLYDALIYVIPRKGATTRVVESVEYYFGRHWNDQIFTTTDRAQGFPILVSAYGPFLAIARLTFNDGSEATVIQRFIDFEMGDIASRWRVP